MAKVSKHFGAGGVGLTPGGSSGRPSLADILCDLADDVAALRPSAVAAADAAATYGAGEQALLNELKAKVNELAAVVLKTTKA
jgi:hypothetical protein